MFRRWVWYWILVGLLLTTAAVSAQDMPEVIITGMWARATQMAQSHSHSMGGSADAVSAAYMTIKNPGEQSFVLVGAMSRAADVIEIHETQVVNEVMQMRPIEGGIEIPAGEAVELKPGGFHIMMMELTQELVEGSAISLTLQFDVPDGAPFEVVIGVPVMIEPPAPQDWLVTGAWARPTVAEMDMDMHGEATLEPMSMPTDSVSAIFMRLMNQGEEDDRLIAAVTDVAGLVEIHETKMMGDVMQMRPVEGGIEIPAGETVELKPGGYHVMLMELQQELVPGTAFLVTLAFESGTEVTVAVPVYDVMGMMAMP